MMGGLLATDLSFTLKNKASNNLQDQDDMNKFMNGVWSGVYWCNFVFGTVFKTFMSKYWIAGHFSVASNVKFALKKIAI